MCVPCMHVLAHVAQGIRKIKALSGKTWASSHAGVQKNRILVYIKQKVSFSNWLLLIEKQNLRPQSWCITRASVSRTAQYKVGVCTLVLRVRIVWGTPVDSCWSKDPKRSLVLTIVFYNGNQHPLSSSSEHSIIYLKQSITYQCLLAHKNVTSISLTTGGSLKQSLHVALYGNSQIFGACLAREHE